MRPSLRRQLVLLALICSFSFGSPASNPVLQSLSSNLGPYNLEFLQGGVGLSRPLATDSPLLRADAPWSITGWIRASRQPGTVVLAALGEPAGDTCRCLVLEDGELGLWAGQGGVLRTRVAVADDEWHAVAATYDGSTARLFVDGRVSASAPRATRPAAPILHLAPHSLGGLDADHFGGKLAGLQVHAEALDARSIADLAASKPNFNLIVFHRVGVGWPWQARAWRGLLEPQDPWTLPRGRTPPSNPVAAPLPPMREPLLSKEKGVWSIGDWRMREAPFVAADGVAISQPEFADDDWYPATVPGTTLTTLIDRGIYPDPDYGLNNLAIPESLARQDYWYRSRFAVPADLAGARLTLTFKGINYSAQVWLNGVRLGDIKGAFIRGVFDVTGKLQPGRVQCPGRACIASASSGNPARGVDRRGTR